MTPRRKFAIAGNNGATVLFWTGRKLRPWTTIEGRAKTWRTFEAAANNLGLAPMGLAMTKQRVLEVAP